MLPLKTYIPQTHSAGVARCIEVVMCDFFKAIHNKRFKIYSIANIYDNKCDIYHEVKATYAHPQR